MKRRLAGAAWSERRYTHLALGGGAVFALTGPPTDLLVAVPVGLMALAVALEAAPRPRRAAWLAWLWATAAGLVGLRFIPSVVELFTPLGLAGGLAGWAALASFQALAWAAAAWLLAAVRARWAIPTWLAFALLVLLASSLPGVFVWTPAGLLALRPSLLQLAELVGERGVSAIVAAAAALLGRPLARWLAGHPQSRRGWAAALVGCALGGGLEGHGQWRLAQLEPTWAAAPRLTLGLVQAAVEAKLRWEPSAREQVLRRLRTLTLEAERAGVALTVWPEAAYPYPLPYAERRLPPGRRSVLGQGVRGPVLFGYLGSTPVGSYNAATIASSSGLLQPPQAKLELLLFGETLPFGAWLPVQVRNVFYRAGGLLPGETVELLAEQAARIGVLNCYEDTLPSVGRRLAAHAPNLLVNLTNDAWFVGTQEPELHLRLSISRAIETRRDLVRAVNLGVPAHIDFLGRVQARGEAHRRGVLVVSPALNETSPTLYARAGDVPMWSALLLLALGHGLHRRRQRAHAVTAPDL